MGRALALALAILLGYRSAAADALYDRLGPLFVTGIHRDDIMSAPTRKLSRWTIPVRVAVAGRRHAIWLPRAEAWLTELARVSGHDIAMTLKAPFNVAVLFAAGFAADAERIPVYKEILQHALKSPAFVSAMTEADRKGEPCFWMIFKKEDVLDSAVVMISEMAPERMQRVCMYGWLLGLTGLSIWNMRMLAPELIDESPEGRVTLTEIGAQLLRMLYDSRLRDQMSIDETLPLLPSIVDGLR
jgi:hypothetical protein